MVNYTLKSPEYPNNYPTNMDCMYSIPIPHGMTMKISFEDFEVEDEYSCRFVKTHLFFPCNQLDEFSQTFPSNIAKTGPPV